MAKPTSYELLGKRVQQTIQHANSRQQYYVYLEPQDGDKEDDWDQLLDEISTNDHAEVTRTDDGNYLVSWNPVEATA